MKYLHIKNISSEDEMVAFGELVGHILFDRQPKNVKKATLIFLMEILELVRQPFVRGYSILLVIVAL
jgi:hypothetical protein